MKKIRIGTRGSAMALYQSNLVRDQLIRAYPGLMEEGAVELVVIKSTGDRIQNKRLSEIGGKGLFIKELETALQHGDIDMAVHSVKDIPSVIEPGFDLPCILERNDPRDCFISPIANSLDDLPAGATVGTCSPRREALTRARRPDVNVVMFRGNADTRLKKLQDGVVDATYLAIAGLQRLGLEDQVTKILDINDMMPACGQGALGIEILDTNDEMRNMLKAINNEQSYRCVLAERACLAAMDGDCHTPIAAYAHYINNTTIHLQALAARTDGSEIIQHNMSAPADSFLALGEEVGHTIKDQMSDDFFDPIY